MANNSTLRAIASFAADDGAFQSAQAASVEEAARSLGIDLKILFAESDALNQNAQLLQIIQGHPENRPDFILVEPVGTVMEQVARAAVSAGIGWVLISRFASYISELRSKNRAMLFSVNFDQAEIGCVQARQLRALLPTGGNVLYIQGAVAADSSRQRAEAMMEAKPESVNVRFLRSNWTETGAYNVVSHLLKLATARDVHISVVMSQNDAMALGARRAYLDAAPDLLPGIVFTGCNGLPEYGEASVREGKLVATVRMPTSAGVGLRLAVKQLREGAVAPEQTIVPVSSLPSINQLKPVERVMQHCRPANS